MQELMRGPQEPIHKKWQSRCGFLFWGAGHPATLGVRCNDAGNDGESNTDPTGACLPPLHCLNGALEAPCAGVVAAAAIRWHPWICCVEVLYQFEDPKPMRGRPQ